MIYDVIIIGLGASGVSASIYAKRSGLNVCVINYGIPGGIISTSSIVENYPGFKSISGSDFAFNLFEQFNNLDVPLFNEEVINIIDGDIKEVKTKNNIYKAKKLIICSGRKPRRLDVENEDKFLGRGISYCATCDGNLYKDKTVCVVGGGNSALESALYLSNLCKKVYILVRKDKFIGNKSLIDEVNEKENICIKFMTNIISVEGNDVVTGVKTNNGEIKLDGIFINIGYEPSINIVKDLNIKLDKNYIVVDEHMETNIKGIYAAGDIIKKDLYQLVTAVSEGAIAATNVYKSIRK